MWLSTTWHSMTQGNPFSGHCMHSQASTCPLLCMALQMTCYAAEKPAVCRADWRHS